MTNRPLFLDGHALPGCAGGQWLNLSALGRLCDADPSLRPVRIHQVTTLGLDVDDLSARMRAHGDHLARGMADAMSDAIDPSVGTTFHPPAETPR